MDDMKFGNFDNGNHYLDKVISRIKQILDARGLSQKEFAQKCGVSASTLSKILQKQSTLSLQMAYTMCMILQVNPSDLFSWQDNTLDNISNLHRRLHTEANEDKHHDSLIWDPDRPCFRGIINNPLDDNDFYYFVSKPTLSNEKKGFLKGILKIFPSGTTPAYCKAVLQLNTGKKDRQNNDIIKTYEGEVVVSLPMGSVYILLTSARYGEINLVTFKHMFFNHDNLACRLCTVSTVSAGSNRRPMVSRAIISRYEFLKEDLQELEGQLFMNDSLIRVNSSDLESVIESSENALSANLKYLKDELMTEVTYCEIDDGVIRTSGKFSAAEKMTLINALRSMSNTPRYVKISGHSDELLYSYVEDVIIPRNSAEKEPQ